MRYLCLVIVDPECFRDLTDDELRAITARSMEYDAELKARGVLIAAHALDEPPTAATIRVRDGETFVTDGPFAELKEHIGGFILIEARDLAEARQIAAEIPMARYGAIEVRAVRPMPR